MFHENIKISGFNIKRRTYISETSLVMFSQNSHISTERIHFFSRWVILRKNSINSKTKVEIKISVYGAYWRTKLFSLVFIDGNINSKLYIK